MTSQTGVATVSSGWFDEHFRCCICLDTYRDPASISCGHNFCIGCIEGYWETKDRFECPICKEAFGSRPDLRVNLDLANVIDYLNRSLSNGGETDAPGSPPSFPDEVLCSVCPDPGTKAVKSCLMCQESYCDPHLALHLRDVALQRHRLTDPATFPSRHLCRKHNQPLDMFCKKDQTPVCGSCSEHKSHGVVSIDRASRKVRATLKETKMDIQKMIEARTDKAEDIQRSVDTGKKMTEKEIMHSVQVCSALVAVIEQQQSDLVQELQRRQDALERNANLLLNQLRTEIKDLQTRGHELLHLELTKDPLYLLQSFRWCKKQLPSRDWAEVSVCPDSGLGAVREAVTRLTQACQDVSDQLQEEEVNKLKEHALNVTLDPVTAPGWLELSADGKKVNLYGQKKKLPVTDAAERFDSCTCVLGKENLKSGRHYWVVQVGDNTDWELGLARESVKRKGTISVRPDYGFWALCRHRGGDLIVCTSPSKVLALKEVPHKVGVFVDCGEGLVSFYDAEKKRHIYSFTGCRFAGAVRPYFNPCGQDNGSTLPLIICPFKET